MELNEKKMFGIWATDQDGCNICKQHDTKVVLLSDPPKPHPNCDCEILPISTEYAKLLLLEKQHNGKQIKPIDGDMELLFSEVEEIAGQIKKKEEWKTRYVDDFKMNQLMGFLFICEEFISYVNAGKEYDIKDQDWYRKKYGTTQIAYDGEYIDNDVPGNVLYGYFGAALGMNKELLTVAGGLVQILGGTSRTEWEFIKNFGDDPKDTQAIIKGMEIYQERHGGYISFWNEVFSE